MPSRTGWLFAAVAAWTVAAFGGAEAAPAGGKLQRLFQFETLGTRLAYLESITGPAMHAVPQNGYEVRDYRVDGCLVTARLQDGNVRALGLDLTPRCSFSLGSFLGNGYGSTAGLTVGKFGRGAFGPSGIRAQSSCIHLCGNAADPEVDFSWDGPHAVNFVGVEMTVVLATNPSLDAEGRWEGIMRRREGAAYIENTRFNCERKHDAEAVQAFADAPVNSVVVGFDLPSADYQRQCGKG